MIRIREVRKNKKMTAKQLAELVNVAESTMSLYENGKREPDYNTLLKIAACLGVTVDYLLGKDDEQKEKNASDGEISVRERSILRAYRKHPEMHSAIEKLLGIDETDKESLISLYTAASSDDNRPDELIKLTAEEWKKISSAPDTDDPLM